MRKLEVLQPPLLVAGMLVCLFASGVALGGFSVDTPPCETALDPGDIFFPGGACDADDGDLTCPPPSLNVPAPLNFDLDAFAIDYRLSICPPQPPFSPGLLFSLDDGDPGAGSGAPDNSTEIFFYDYCRAISATRQSYFTTMTEAALGLGANPPPLTADDDVDAFDTRPAGLWYQMGVSLLFSPDTPANGGLGPGSEGNIYSVNALAPFPAIWATPASLGVPDIVTCNIDGIAPIIETGQPAMLLFTTDAAKPCGLDPGDVYSSDLAGHMWLWADDVKDLRIAETENDPVDIDALAINDGGDFRILDPYEPPDLTTYKADWPNYAPSGMPDFSQDRAEWPFTTWCGPTALADSFWWFDSEMECEKDRTTGDAAESEPNNTCAQADKLGETPAIPGSLMGPIEDRDWYVFEVPKHVGEDRCRVTISTCALRQPGDADTLLRLYAACDAGNPDHLISQNDNACSGDGSLQSEINVALSSGRYWVEVSGFGDSYTISLGLDCYPLVERRNETPVDSRTPDDHSNLNPKVLIEDLSWCMNTDDQQGTGSGHKGTRIDDLLTCIDTWLIDKRLEHAYTRQTVLAPAYEQVASEVEASEDVLLLLGFYWATTPTGPWTRCGGHYVTAAGVDTASGSTTVSDPALNNAEPPNSAPGRVRGPDHTNHTGATPLSHDDAQNVSHDRYLSAATKLGPPIARWAMSAFATAGTPTRCQDVYRWCMGMEYGQNPRDPLQPQAPCPVGSHPVTTEVEAMVDVSPVQTPVCVLLDPLGAWPNNIRVERQACPSPSPTSALYDVIRGKLCNVKFSMLIAQVDLGHVQCLYDDSHVDQWDDLSPDMLDCAGAWFYLVRQSTDPDYGHASGGEPRVPSSGGCP